MGFGAALTFIAIGAVLAFAVRWDVPGIDLQMIGWILMGVGVVAGVITRMYTRKPGEESVEVVEPDIVYTTDFVPESDPRHVHVHDHRQAPVEEPRGEDPTRPHHHLYRDGPA
ncbi:hypothetical protein C1I98_32255 [Spongiactinospora gelatinilytica]|uniref:DUF6458 domain-containing protein n=1 Tax=Spongiactinospora gelatinilytica TaxID=2666298 RepID=A0A2W2EXF1_9ACTN|nr:DUF6458 family protein [Spongiactinospora gelatinilytica]PZG29296.1 hypothetical protein C1I98_32255 [Spongiactinospora gelatinilytica]